MLLSQLLFYLKNFLKKKKAVTLSFLSRPLKDECTPVIEQDQLWWLKWNILSKKVSFLKMVYIIHSLFQLFPQVRGPDKMRVIS